MRKYFRLSKAIFIAFIAICMASGCQQSLNKAYVKNHFTNQDSIQWDSSNISVKRHYTLVCMDLDDLSSNDTVLMLGVTIDYALAFRNGKSFLCAKDLETNVRFAEGISVVPKAEFQTYNGVGKSLVLLNLYVSGVEKDKHFRSGGLVDLQFHSESEDSDSSVVAYFQMEKGFMLETVEIDDGMWDDNWEFSKTESSVEFDRNNPFTCFHPKKKAIKKPQ